MPLRLENGTAYLEGRCPPEEAETLLEYLRVKPMPAVDLSDCEDFHSALLQVLMVARPVIASLPANPFLVELLTETTVTAARPEFLPNLSVDSGDRNDPGA